jgi:hypothetical protein
MATELFHGLIPLTPEGWPSDEPLLLLNDVRLLWDRHEAEHDEAIRLLDRLLREVYEPVSGRVDGDGPLEYDELFHEPSPDTCREIARFLARRGTPDA